MGLTPADRDRNFSDSNRKFYIIFAIQIANFALSLCFKFKTMIKRHLSPLIINQASPGKAILVFGARQTGKTTLIKSLFDQTPDTLWLNGDEPDVRSLLSNITSSRLKAYVGNHKRIVIDEAQRIENIGITLKLITDQMQDIQLIVTGSSALELAKQTQESLTGRKWDFRLYPLSFSELADHHGLLEEKRLLPHRLVYGSYPEVVNSIGTEREVLRQLSDSYLYKDLLMLEGIKKPDKIIKLLQAMAWQIGSEVSYHELGKTVGLDNQTTEKYIELLEKTWIIFRLGAFSRNLRKKLKKSRKIYFYDNGIRNALLARFDTIEMRDDRVALWENYLMSERVKFIHYSRRWVLPYFWRTHDQQEIDYLEEANGKLMAWEFKWNPKAKARMPKAFAGAYPGTDLKTVTPDNIEDFLLE